jgi:hypothetical protein
MAGGATTREELLELAGSLGRLLRALAEEPAARRMRSDLLQAADALDRTLLARAAPTADAHGSSTIVGMFITETDMNNSSDRFIEFTAELGVRVPSQAAWTWWQSQLRELGVHGGSWSPSGERMTLRLRVPADELEDATRRLIVAIREVDARYPADFEASLQELEQRKAAERRQNALRAAPYQAILDRVMNDYAPENTS